MYYLCIIIVWIYYNILIIKKKLKINCQRCRGITQQEKHRKDVFPHYRHEKTGHLLKQFFTYSFEKNINKQMLNYDYVLSEEDVFIYNIKE